MIFLRKTLGSRGGDRGCGHAGEPPFPALLRERKIPTGFRSQECGDREANPAFGQVAYELRGARTGMSRHALRFLQCNAEHKEKKVKE